MSKEPKFSPVYNKPLKSYEKFFSTWKQETLDVMSQEAKDNAYNDYATKHDVYNRDNFTCQVEGCTFNESVLTIHHYKHESNGGPTKPRNCVTVCRAHQNQYHSARTILKFKDNPLLPAHIRGSSQAMDKIFNKTRRGTIVRPKAEAREMRVKRKAVKEEWGKRLSWKEIVILLYWLFGKMDKFHSSNPSPVSF